MKCDSCGDIAIAVEGFEGLNLCKLCMAIDREKTKKQIRRIIHENSDFLKDLAKEKKV